MPDDYFTRSQAAAAARRSGPSLRAVLGTSLLAFIGGAALVGWLVWDGRITLTQNDAAPAPASASASFANLPKPAASPTAAASSKAAQDAALGGMDQRIAALEQRLTRIDLQAAASEGNTARAEALLVAFAARRALERGAPLGYLADQLKLRFGEAQPGAVATVIDTAQNPVTLDRLAGQFDALAPTLINAPRGESGWDQFTRELSGLFVIRHGDGPSARPEQRLERIRVLLRTGQIDAALADVERLPGAAAAGEWTNAARRYAAGQRALDLIETTALIDTQRLKTASGAPVEQPGVDAAPAPANPAPKAAAHGTVPAKPI